VSCGDRHGATHKEVYDAIVAWCKEHLGVELPVTCTKDYQMVELWDDRCVQVLFNSGIPVNEPALQALARVERCYQKFLDLGDAPPQVRSILEEIRTALGIEEPLPEIKKVPNKVVHPPINLSGETIVLPGGKKLPPMNVAVDKKTGKLDFTKKLPSKK
jgi:hypothetical protein